jgi:hypothetical protein
MPLSLGVIIVDKLSSLKTLTIKDYVEEDLYKKCGFKKSTGFELQVEWPIKLDGQKYIVAMYGKLDGKSNMENKYDFPPPIDKKIYFGSCALVCMIRDDANNKEYINLSIALWNKMYEKLFGGFEDLTMNCVDDDEEDDELEKVAVSLKTKKGGYLKDGFVIDGSDNEDELDNDNLDDDNLEETITNSENDDDELELEIGDIGSELSEEDYDYSDNDEK